MLHPERTAVLVLGMHRSGTSALARVFNLLGAVVPKDLIAPNEFNPQGYWEGRNCRDANESLLASANSIWCDYRCLDPDLMERVAKRQGDRERIKDVISHEFGDAPLFVLKDPRICRFLPLILSILDELNVRPVAVLAVRNPLEVAASLRERDGLTQSMSLLLWLRHVLDAEYYSRPIRRSFLDYADLLLDWRTCLGRGAIDAGLALPRWSSESESLVDQFLTTEFYRQRASAEQLQSHPEVGSWVKDAYAIVSRLAKGEERRPDLDRLDRIRDSFDEACEVMGPAIKEKTVEGVAIQIRLQAAVRETEMLRRKLQAALKETDMLRHKLQVALKEREMLRRELQLLIGRFSWKAGKPLRVLGAKFPRATNFLKRSLRF